MNYLVQVDGASEYFIGVLFKTSWALNLLVAIPLTFSESPLPGVPQICGSFPSGTQT